MHRRRNHGWPPLNGHSLGNASHLSSRRCPENFGPHLHSYMEGGVEELPLSTKSMALALSLLAFAPAVGRLPIAGRSIVAGRVA